MKFTVSKEVFIQHVGYIHSIIDNKSAEPVLTNILLETINRNTINLKGTDKEITLSCQMNCEVFEQGSITVNSSKLYEIIRKMEPFAVIECEVNDGQFLIKNEKTIFSLNTIKAENFPATQEVNINKTIEINGLKLAKSIEYVKFSMGIQDVRQYLNGLHFDASEDELTLVSTDGHRLSLIKIEHSGIESNSEEKPFKIILPRKSVPRIQTLLGQSEGNIKIELSNRHLRFSLNNFQILTRLIDGEYPDYKAVIPDYSQKPIVIAREPLAAAISRARSLNSRSGSGVRFTFQGHQVNLMARNTENEVARDSLEIFNPEDISLQIGFDIVYLLEVLRAVSQNNIQVNLGESTSPCLITIQEIPELLYIIMPMYI